jgi:branched-chain amino acid transport system permease protein
MLRELGWLKAFMVEYFDMTNFDPAQYRGLLFGLAMVVMMVVRPRGFVSTRSPSIYLARRTAVSGELVKEGHG